MLSDDLVLDVDCLLVGDVFLFDHLPPQLINFTPNALVSLTDNPAAFHLDLLLNFKFLNCTPNDFYGLSQLCLSFVQGGEVLPAILHPQLRLQHPLLSPFHL